MESFYATGTENKIDALCVERIFVHCDNVFEAMQCSNLYQPFQEAPPSLIDEETQRRVKTKELDELGKHFIEE